LKVLGEASMKYLSGAVQNWRAGPTTDNLASPHASAGELVHDLLISCLLRFSLAGNSAAGSSFAGSWVMQMPY